MDKKDILYVIGAFLVILVVAVVVKPVTTGQPANLGIAAPTTGQTVPAETTPLSQETPVPVTTVPATTVPTTTIPTPAPTPTWSGQAQTVGFVNPATYGLSMNQSLPGGTRIENVPVDTSMTSFAKISGEYSGTTDIINIPFPYWELSYTAEPAGKYGGEGQKLGTSSIKAPTESGMSGGSHTVMQGSYSVVFPSLTIQVMDANDPNRIVRTVSPPGGINPEMWGTTIDGVVVPDPRPWKEKFFEGQRSYFFIINANSLSSYDIEILVPTKYVGKY